ncbi:hypothetical protein SAMN03159288_02733 [Rhizobium sp. NFACC06-2]|nr:hypothetical protein SAMN03159288_02733 [Rhizobium sp. NFACC06-2]
MKRMLWGELKGKGKPVDLPVGVSSGLPSIGGDSILTCPAGIGSGALNTLSDFAS